MKLNIPNLSPPTPKTIVFSGGINEALSNLEIKPGQCFDMTNYEEINGEFHGYRSTMGYEVIDGTEVTITNPNNTGETLDVTYASTVPLVYDNPDDFSSVDDTAREDRRAAIVAPSGVTYLKGAFDYNGDYFALGYTVATGDHTLYVMSPTGGWLMVSTFPSITEGVGVDAGYNYQISNVRLQFFPLVSAGATPNSEVCILCNGITQAVILWKTDLGVYNCTLLDEANSPSYPGATPVLPSDASIDEGFPMRSAVWNQRLHLAYPSGTLFVSHSGDPFAYDPAVTSGGVFWLGSEITDLLVSPSSLTVFQEKGIDLLQLSEATTSGFNESKEQFSALSGAFPNTAERILGRSLFCDERGISSLEATDSYGDFGISNLSKNVQRTYQKNKANIVGAVVDREKSQYIIYFNDGQGIILTCETNYYGDLVVRGVSLFKLDQKINTVKEVIKQPMRFITSPDDGFLRLQHKDAASFNGSEIISRFTSSFHAYGSPTNFKTFQRLLFELSANKGQVFKMRPIYDYQGSNIPKSMLYDTEPQAEEPAEYGTGVWGVFVWGGTGAVNTEYSYITGIAVNMAIQFSCSSKHHTPHVVHNVITLYANGATKW